MTPEFARLDAVTIPTQPDSAICIPATCFLTVAKHHCPTRSPYSSLQMKKRCAPYHYLCNVLSIGRQRKRVGLTSTGENVMDQIIAGRFETKAKADAAAAVIVRYVDRTDICIFHNNPPGQHGTPSTTATQLANPGLETDGEAAVGTALAAGLAAGVIGLAGGPVVALAAAGVGAYTGSLVGAMGGMQDEESHQLPNLRPAGVILAVRIARASSEKPVVSDLRTYGAEDIEKADGDWRDGDWVDFNPLQEPHLIAA